MAARERSPLDEFAEALSRAERLKYSIVEDLIERREFKKRAGWTAELPGALGQIVRGALVEEPPPLTDLGSIIPWTIGASLGFYLTAQTGGALGALLGWNRVYRALKGLRFAEKLLSRPNVVKTISGVAIASTQSLLGRVFVGRPEDALEKAAQDGAYMAVLGVAGEYIFSPIMRRIVGERLRRGPATRQIPALPPPRTPPPTLRALPRGAIPQPPPRPQTSLFEEVTPRPVSGLGPHSRLATTPPVPEYELIPYRPPGQALLTYHRQMSLFPETGGGLVPPTYPPTHPTPGGAPGAISAQIRGIPGGVPEVPSPLPTPAPVPRTLSPEAEEGLRLFEQTLRAFEASPVPETKLIETGISSRGLGIIGTELVNLFEEYAAGNKNVSFANLFRKKEFLQKYAERIQRRLQSEFTEGDASNAIGRVIAELETGFAFTRSELEDLRRIKNTFATGKTSMPLKELVNLWEKEPEALAAVAFGHPGWLPVRLPRNYRDIIELKALDKIAEKVIVGGTKTFVEEEPVGSTLYNLGRSIIKDLREEVAKNPNASWKLDTFQKYVRSKVLEKLGLQGIGERIALRESGIGEVKVVTVGGRVPLDESTRIVAPDLHDRLEVMAAVVGKMTGRSADDVLKEVMTTLAGSDEKYLIEGLRQLSVKDAYQALLMMESMIPQDKVSVVKELLEVSKYWGRMSSEPLIGFLEFLERNPEEYARMFLKQPHVSEVKTLTIEALEQLRRTMPATAEESEQFLKSAVIETSPIRTRVPVKDPTVRGLQEESPETLGGIISTAERIRRETRTITERTPSNLLEAARNLLKRTKSLKITKWTPKEEAIASVREIVDRVPRSSSEISRFSLKKGRGTGWVESLVLGKPPGAVGDASIDEEVALWKTAIKAIADLEHKRRLMMASGPEEAAQLAGEIRNLYTWYMDDVVNRLLEGLPKNVRSKLGSKPTLWEVIKATKSSPEARKRYLGIKNTLMKQFVEFLSRREGTSIKKAGTTPRKVVRSPQGMSMEELERARRVSRDIEQAQEVTL